MVSTINIWDCIHNLLDWWCHLVKLTLGLLATITPRVAPFYSYTLFPVLLPFRVVYCEGIQHCLWFYLDRLSCVKMATFQFFVQSEKHGKVIGSQVRQVGWVEMIFMLFLVKNSIVEKEVCDDALSWCNSHFFCRQSFVRSLCIF
jgi:hypothetical protein